MSQSDLLADVLTRIRNGQMAGHAFVLAPSSKLIKAVLSVLEKEGYINQYEEFAEKKGINKLKIDLKYYQHTPVIKEIKKISKPGKRVYSSIKQLQKVYGGLGVFVLSTSSGVISDDMARNQNIGGEVLCKVF